MKCEKRESKFTYLSFKPCIESLFNYITLTITEESREEKVKEFECKRISEVYSLEEITIIENIQLDDINQGEIGNCYFMAAMSGMATHYPNLLKDIFLTKEPDRNG